MPRQLFLLELNEVNFEFVEAYGANGQLPTLTRLIREHGLSRTTSETRYEQLEPWIQWVTAHTGQSFAEHGVFRLGDGAYRNLPQIWEALETHGLRVGAVSPMNAKHNVRNPAFFVPDPWTRTAITARPTLRRLHKALSQAVNENATGTLTLSSIASLISALLVYARPSGYAAYLGLAATARGRPWRKAIAVDLLLSDVFVAESLRARPHFASLFLNGAAHIQHHYLFCAKTYRGTLRNPSWYVGASEDPVIEVYAAYDKVIGRVLRAFPGARIMIATGLHQEPHETVTFYWRLKDHAAFLRAAKVPFVDVRPLMSRDFVVVCADTAAAKRAAARLGAAIAHDGERLFEIDNRGAELFVALTYPREIGPGFAYTVEGDRYEDLARDVAFVALKNGQHNGTGYFIDTGVRHDRAETEFPLTDLPRRVHAALGVPC